MNHSVDGAVTHFKYFCSGDGGGGGGTRISSSLFEGTRISSSLFEKKHIENNKNGHLTFMAEPLKVFYNSLK